EIDTRSLHDALPIYTVGGGGGGALNTGTNQVNTAGVQAGDGQVVIYYAIVGNAYTSQIQGLPSGSAFPVGTTTQVFVVTDSIGRSEEHTSELQSREK